MKLLKRTISGTALALFPGWVFLLAGIATVMACLMVPAWQEHQMMQWRKLTLEAQVHLLDQQAGIYKQFDNALEQQNPILLQRLAYTQLGLIPEGTGPLQLNQPLPPVGSPTYSTQHTDGWFSALADASTSGQDVYESVLEPGKMPRAIQPPQMASSSFVRLTTGPLRSWVMLLGLLGIVLGLMSHPRSVSQHSATLID
jgi:hypothetical protein